MSTRPRRARQPDGAGWSPHRAERYLRSLELFGMRFGLDRMRRLTTALGTPQESFDSIHVVGTNGKSSTTRMIAAILQRHGLRSGAYLSPHLRSFAERVRVGDRDVGETDFAAAVGRAARAAELVDRTLASGDHVTQFEALTAAAYSELARQAVDVAVIEAGLGGRYDATNVVPSSVQVLTSVGLEHTRWLGPTITDIAREKLAVVRPGSTLVLGCELDPEAEAEAERVASEQGVQILRAPAELASLARVDTGAPAMGAQGGFQRRNFALAATAAQAYLRTARGADWRLDELAVAAAAAATTVPGRFDMVGSNPVTVLDGAHNPEGMRALVQAVGELGLEPVFAVVSILDDKDAAAMLRVLLPRCREVVFTAADTPRALPPATLASLAGQLGGPPTRVEPDPERAMALAAKLADPGLVLATGSIYLVANLMRTARRA